jgi:CBS domain containing-hemolysin-like protein
MKRSRFEKLRRRAIRVGIRTSKRVHHQLNREEVLALRVQVIPLLPRIVVGLIGAALILASWLEWPSPSNAVQAIECISGILLTLFAIFGVSRTLGEIVGNIDLETGGDLVKTVIEAISDSIDF